MKHARETTTKSAADFGLLVSISFLQHLGLTRLRHRRQWKQQLLLSQVPFSNPYPLAHLLLLQLILLFHRIMVKAISSKVIASLLTMYFLMGQPLSGRLLWGVVVIRRTAAPMLPKQLQEQA